METHVVVPIRSILYKRCLDDINNRFQKSTSDVLHDPLSNYNPKIKLTIETNLQRFCIQKQHISMVQQKHRYAVRKQNYWKHGYQTFLKGIKETPSKQNYIVKSEFHQILQVT